MGYPDQNHPAVSPLSTLCLQAATAAPASPNGGAGAAWLGHRAAAAVPELCRSWGFLTRQVQKLGSSCQNGAGVG